MLSIERQKTVVMLLYEARNFHLQKIKTPTSDFIDCTKHFSLNKNVQIRVLNVSDTVKHKEIGFRLLGNKSLAKRMTHFVSSACEDNQQLQLSQYIKINKKDVKCIFNDLEKTKFFQSNNDNQIPLNLMDGALFGNDSTSYLYCRLFAEKIGILVGKSSSLNLFTTSVLSHQITDGTIVTILPDEGKSDFDVIFNTNWNKNNGLHYNIAQPENAKLFYVQSNNQSNENIDSYRCNDAELNWRNGRIGDVHYLLDPPLNEEKNLWSKYKNYSSRRFLNKIEPNGTLDDYKGHYKNIDPSSSINRSTSDYMISDTYSRLTSLHNKKKQNITLIGIHLILHKHKKMNFIRNG